MTTLQTLKRLVSNQRGDFGVKEIGMIVAAVVVIAAIVAFLGENIPDLLQNVWERITDLFDSI